LKLTHAHQQAAPISMHWGRGIYPAVLFNNPHDIVGKGHRDDREGNRKKRLFEDGHTETVACRLSLG
jgi:hypothetical protein